MVGRYAVIDDSGTVTTVALWDGVTEWDHGAAAIRKLSSGSPVAPGWTHQSDDTFVEPAPVEESTVVAATVDTSLLAEAAELQKTRDFGGAISKIIEAIATIEGT